MQANRVSPTLLLDPEEPSVDAGAAQALPTRQQFRVSKLLLRYYWAAFIQF